MLELGYIAKAFGIKGAVQIKLFNESSEALATGIKLSVQQAKKPSQELTVKEFFGGSRLFFREINSRTEAESLQGAKISIARDSLPKNADEYYLSDILGAKVIHIDGSDLGVIIGFSSNNAQTLLSIKTTDGLEAYVPLVKPIVKEILLDKKIVIIDPPLGLLALADS